MSYDLIIKPKKEIESYPSLSDITHKIRNIKALKIKEIDKAHFEFIENSNLIVTLNIKISQGSLAEAIEISMPFSEEIPKNTYLLCSELGKSFGWQIYDPQGNNWYTPEDLFSLSKKEIIWDFESLTTLILIISVIIALSGGLIWYFRGQQPWDASFWITVAGLTTSAICGLLLKIKSTS